MRWIPPALAEEFASQGTDAYRIADGEECRIERFGDGVIISHTAENPPSDLVEELGAWCGKAGVKIERMYARRLVIGPGKDDAPRPIGRSPRQRTSVVHEEGLCYEIDFLAGYSCGLFLDQRANRRRLRASNAETPAERLRLHVFVFPRRSRGRRAHTKHRPVKVRARTRTPQLRAQRAFSRRTSLHR